MLYQVEHEKLENMDSLVLYYIWDGCYDYLDDIEFGKDYQER